jgi:TolA-binding protein
MTRRLLSIPALASILLAGLSAAPALALTEADRLWLVGERAFVDGLHPVARRTLERFVADNPSDPRIAQATLLLGRTRLVMGEPEKALESFRRLRAIANLPAQQLEGRFWEAESLYRLKQYAAARSAYDDVISKDAASPMAPEAIYGVGLCDLELKRPEAAIKAFRELLKTWPDHAQAGSATFYLAQTLVETKKYSEAVPLLSTFETKYPKSKLVPDAHYLLGMTRLAAGEREAGVKELQAFIAANPNHQMVPAARRAITDGVAKSGTPTQQKAATSSQPGQQKATNTQPSQQKSTSTQPSQQKATTSQTTQSSATADSLYDAGVSAGRNGDVKGQQAAWARLRKEYPNHPLSYQAAYDLAESAFKKKEWTQAATQAKAAAGSDEEALRARAHLLAGESELKLSRYKDAAKSFEAVGNAKNLEAGDRYRALAGLGLAHEQLGEIRAALAAYDAVATKSPDTKLRDFARERAAALRAQPTQPTQPSKPAAGGEKKS